MEIGERLIEDTYIISISGRMDTINSKDVESKLEEAINERRARIIINLKDVDYISSVGLRVLLAALQKQQSNHGSMRLAALQPFVQNVFRITGLDTVFPIYITQDAAFNSP